MSNAYAFAAPEPNAAPRTTALQRVLPIAPVSTAEEVEPAPRSKHSLIMLPTLDGYCFEKVKHINYLEASGNYVMLHFTDGRQVLVCKTLGDVERMLPPDRFVRIHRSHTIHLRYIRKYVRGKGGHVVMHNGITLVVATGQRDALLDALKRFF